MKITVSELVCLQNDLETYETIEDQILEMNTTVYELQESVEEDDIEIRKLIKNQQDIFENHVNDEFNDLQEEVEDQGLKDTDLISAFDDLKEDHEEVHTDLKKLIKEQSDLNAAQKVTVDTHITQFNTLKKKVEEDHAEEFAELNATILAIAMPPQCSNYKSLTDPSRRFDFIDSTVKSDSSKAFCDKKNGYTHKRPTSDDWVGGSWYRIQGGAGTKLSEKVYDRNSENAGACGTYIGSHMIGGHPNLPGQSVTRSVHFGLKSNYHYNNHDIEVTNCNGFFVYKLVGMTNCYFRYCTQ